MNALDLIKSLRILDYFVLESKCSSSPEHADAITDNQLESETDAALDSSVSAFHEYGDHTEFTTTTHVEYRVSIVNQDSKEDAIKLELSFVTRFRVDAKEPEAKEFLKNNDWIFRQRNATLSHFLGGQVLDKTAFNIGLPMN